MDYKVILSDFAKQQLARSGASLKLCDEPDLAQYGYRKIHFSSHKYIMLYIIEGKEIHIDRIYHELEDYQALPD